MMQEWQWWEDLEGEERLRNAWGWPHYDEVEVAQFIEDNTIVSRHALDIGCGPGRLGHTLARRNPWVQFHGIDVSPTMIAHSQVGAPNNWTASVNDGRTLPDGIYGVIYSVTVFQHIPSDVVQSYVSQAYDRLENGGGALIFTYAVGDEVAPRSYQVTTEDAESWCHQFDAVVPLDTPDTHPAWNWMVAIK